MAPAAPLPTHQILVLLLQSGVLLWFALFLGRLGRPFGIPPVAAELCTGVLLGPSLLGHLAPGLSGRLFPRDAGQFHLLDAVGQLGVLLLVGMAGMDIDLGLIRRQGAKAVTTSAGGLLVPLALGVCAGLLLPGRLVPAHAHRGVFAAFLGVAMCVSAIPVIAKTLLEMRLLHRDIGQLIMSAAAVGDIAGWLLLSVVSAMVTGGFGANTLPSALGQMLLAAGVAVLIGRPVVGLALRLAARSPNPAVPVTAVVVILLLCGAGTQALGMEAVVGALFGGLLIGSSRRIDRKSLKSMRGFVMAVLAPLYFATAGLRIDLTALGSPVVLLSAVAVLVIAIAGKFSGAYLGARLSRLGHWNGVALGSGLNARGVIEVVVAMAGLRLGVLSPAMYAIVILVAVVTSLMAPPLLRFSAARIDVTDTEMERERILVDV